MKNVRHLVFAALVLLLAVPAWAYDFEVDGIRYNITSNDAPYEVSVTFKNQGTENLYSGNVVIPATVVYENKTYSVTSIGRAAFLGCTGLTSVTIPNSVTSIGEAAFLDCTGLTSVTIPNSVTSIGDRAFSGCTGLTSVTIPNSVTSIGYTAFSGCTGLTSVTIGNSVTSIGDGAFYGCTGLTSMVVASGNPKYDSRGNCNAIIETETNTLVSGCKTTVIPNSVTSIGRAAFLGCTGLTSVTIPNSVTSIGDYAFLDCTGLTSVTIGNSVTSIGWSAFSDCTGLTSVTIPNSVTSIGDYAFLDCTGLTSVTIGNSVTNIGYAAFSGCTGLTSVTIGNSVTSIGGSAFSGCTGLTSVTIPNSVTSIWDRAFSGCTGLTSVTIPNSVTSIGWSAFSGCTGLTSVTIPNSVTSIGYAAFSGCTGLTSMVVASGNPKYDSRGNCNAIIETETNTLVSGCKTTVIPNSVTSIGHYAFSGCTGLTSVTIPNSVTSIGDDAFTNTGIYNNDANWTEGVLYLDNCLIEAKEGSISPNYQIKAGTRVIASSAFSGCTGLTSVTIGNSVTSIGGYAFSGCTGLTSVTIGNSVTSIGRGAFSGCTGLTSMVVASGNPKYDSRGNCNAIIETDTNTLVSGCKTTVIPNSVTSIGGSAFSGCTGLTSVTIPNSVTSIGDAAFSGCTGLTSVTVKATTPPSISSNTFPSEAKQFYVPCGYEEAYRNASYWSNFNSIIGADFTFALEVASSDASLGQASIAQQPDCENHVATVVAQPTAGHPFKHWLKDGVVVSTANPYTFEVASDIRLVAYFEGTGVGEADAVQVAVSPNPTKGQVNIACENMKAVALCTIDGRTIKTCKASGNSLTMEMDGVAQGLYLLRIETGDGVVVNRKIIKE